MATAGGTSPPQGLDPMEAGQQKVGIGTGARTEQTEGEESKPGSVDVPTKPHGARSLSNASVNTTTAPDGKT